MVEEGPSLARDRVLVVGEAVDQQAQVVVADLAQPGERLGVEDAVELGGELRVLGGLEIGREPPQPGRLHVVAEDLGQLVDERGQVGRLEPLDPAAQLGGHDVEPSLHQPAEVGEAGLHLLALGPHGPDLLDRAGLELAEIGGVEKAVELAAGHRPRVPGATPPWPWRCSRA